MCCSQSHTIGWNQVSWNNNGLVNPTTKKLFFWHKKKSFSKVPGKPSTYILHKNVSFFSPQASTNEIYFCNRLWSPTISVTVTHIYFYSPSIWIFACSHEFSSKKRKKSCSRKKKFLFALFFYGCQEKKENGKTGGIIMSCDDTMHY